MIEIKAFFKWREVTPEQAFEFCNEMIKSGMPNVDPDKRIERINKYHLRGITYQELMGIKEVKKDDKEAKAINR